ncbi:hypothetical protein PFICI_01977 [Pestalotiopsis fici W106-1]|uniref:Uncharacterized protein n=1 Tax=Pestalotiopsis fici (strain W106-1 / CGMCC3.15140) TaxID=1229662 RepID=W3XQ84_PESFW|nr:uncharacterized protein PFICI_01977 [Pestalotiopsis fici W106-1]ETS88149.1 hypothetical protein PFICI_01977 [Pestalotiopsis fici W106-1]
MKVWTDARLDHDAYDDAANKKSKKAKPTKRRTKDQRKKDQEQDLFGIGCQFEQTDMASTTYDRMGRSDI